MEVGHAVFALCLRELAKTLLEVAVPGPSLGVAVAVPLAGAGVRARLLLRVLEADISADPGETLELCLTGLVQVPLGEHGGSRLRAAELFILEVGDGAVQDEGVEKILTLALTLRQECLTGVLLDVAGLVGGRFGLGRAGEGSATLHLGGGS